MNKSPLLFISGVPVVLALVASGWATKHYVTSQLAPANSKISALETKTDQQADREQTDVSRLEEKLGSTDSRLADVASVAEQANAGAAQANQLAQQDQAAAAANQSAIAINSAGNYDPGQSYDLFAGGHG